MQRCVRSAMYPQDGYHREKAEDLYVVFHFPTVEEICGWVFWPATWLETTLAGFQPVVDLIRLEV